ncbi:HEAT repeat domain-containing protein [Halopiger goleimassiliensis]|uniref:HEAT repeat domain-containing protein n=1 Tax=Halopiger goleimassiliensis TaxID=1293048 RepID=UPI000677B82F|nr:HEAT repeat domain-containing protein [Halopiger goleimassiliensis]
MSGEETTFLYELARNGDRLKLIEYLTQADNPVVRERAAELLGGLTTGPDPDVQDRITRALRRTAKHDESDAVRAAAIDALYLRDESALEDLVAAVADAGLDETPPWMTADRPADWLESPHPEFRMLAAAALGRIGDPAAVPALVAVFDDHDVRVRAEAVEACGEIGDPRCIEPLANRLDDDQDRVRREAASALAAIGTEAARRALAPAVRSNTESVRVIAVGELGAFGNLEPLPLLIEGLQDSSELVRRTATRSLIELLANAPSERSHEMRNAIGAAIAEAELPDLAAQLRTVLGGNQPTYVRRNATWLLGQVADSDADDFGSIVASLVDALDDSDEMTAKFAMSTLVDLDDPTVARRLREFLRDDGSSDRARQRAEFVLERVREGPSKEVVSNAVEFTYVSDPADYTTKKRERADREDDAE